jgi:hypothetical protein
VKGGSRRAGGVQRLALALLLAVWISPASGVADTLVRPLGEAQVDWERGLLRVRAGAAPDLRMPGPDAARADAQRRATDRARGMLKEALGDLPLGSGRKLSRSTIEAAVGRSRTLSVDYQSNGGVLLEIELAFADLDPPKPGARPPAGSDKDKDKDKDKKKPEELDGGLVLAVASMPLEARVTLLFRKEELTTGALYRLGEPPKASSAVRARRDRSGRLILPAGTLPPSPQSPVIIYVRSLAKR